MAGLVTIGKVGVKVRPDTTDFPREARAQLEVIERRLKVKIPAELDSRKFARDLRHTINRLNSPNEKAKRALKFTAEVDDRAVTNALKDLDKQVGSKAADKKISMSVDPSSYDSVMQTIAQIDREIARLREIQITADMDEDQLRDLQSRLKGWLDTTEVDLKINDDPSGWQKALSKIDQMIAERTAIDIKVDADLDSLREARETFQKRLDAQPVELKFSPDESGVDKALRAIDERLREFDETKVINLNVDEKTLRETRKHLQDLKNDYEKIDSEVQAHAETVAARAELARVARTRIVTLVVNVSKSSVAKAEATLAALSGLRMLRSTLDNVWDLFKNLDKSIPIIGTIAEAVLGLSAGLLASASNTFALARALAQIGPLALLLPGVAGGFAVGIGASVAVLRDFNKELPHVKQAFKDIQDQMSATFWRQAEKPIRNFIDNLLPQFAAGLQVTSALLGKWFGGLAEALEHSFDGALGQMFTDLAASIQIATGANGALANSITILGRHGARYLPRLAGWYADIITRFSDWLTEAERSGRLWEWTEIAVQNLKDLGRVLGNTGSILAGIARAANEAGGSGLDSLADTLERVADTVNGEPFKSNLVTVLRSAHAAMSLISEQSGPQFKAFFADFSTTLAQGLTLAGDAIGELLRGVFEALDTRGFAEGFIAFLNGVRDGIKSLSGVWEPLGNALGGIGQIAGEMARSFGPLLADLLQTLSRILVENLPAIQSTIRSLTDAVGAVLPVILPVIEGAAKAIANLGSSSLSSATGIAAVAVALGSLRVALSGGAIAQGLVGLMTFFGKTGDVDKMTGSIKRFTAVAGGIAVAVAGFAALTDWIIKSGTATPEVDALATALERLGNSRTAENLERVNKALIPPAQKHWLLETRADIQFQGLSDGISSVADAMQLVSERAASSGWQKFIGAGDANNYLGLASTGYQQAAKSIEALDQAMAEVVSSGNAEAIAASERMLQDAARERGIVYEDFVKNHLPNYVAAQEAAAVAQETTARLQQEALRGQQAAMAQYELAVSRAQGLTPALLGTINEASQGFIDLSAALQGEALPSVDQWISKLEEQVAAQAAWADNMVALAKRGVSEGVLQELAKLGPEGAPMVAQLVDATDGELTRLEDVMKAKTGGAAADVKSQFSKMNADVAAELSKLSPETQAVLEDMGITMSTGGQKAGQALSDALRRKKEAALDAATAVADSAVTGAKGAESGMGSAGSKAGQGMADGVRREAGGARSAGASLGQGAVQGAQSVSLVSAGIQAAAGFIQGLQSRVSGAISAAKSMAANAVSAIKKKLDIHSPSRVTRELGSFTGQGFVLGILDEKRHAEKAMQSIADAVMDVDFQSPFADMEVSAKTGRASVRSSLVDPQVATVGRTTEINFNAPVGGDPYEIARSIEQRQNDAMALEGLDL